MALRPREIAGSAVFALLAGAVVWPPIEGVLYWTALAPLGDAVVAPVVLVSALLGAAFARRYPVTPRSFAIGATGAYLLAMALVEWVLTPEGPVHFVLYSFVLIGLAVGVGVAAAMREEPEESDGRSGERADGV